MSTPSAVLAGEALWAVLEGDCVALDLPRGSLDSVVSDPPAGIGFMGKGWDHDKGGRDAWIAWMTARMRVAFALLKPGGHAVIWALPRTSHWTATAVEDAGFEIRDVLTHHFGSGFPKSANISKHIDAAAGAVREVVGPSRHNVAARFKHGAADVEHDHGKFRPVVHAPETAPATPEAAQWEGWGTALKPASEHWILARKPLIGTVAANVLAHGTGGINVGACRVGFSSPADEAESKGKNRHGDFESGPMGNSVYGVFKEERSNYEAPGRWPTNLLLSHGEGCREVGTRDVAGDARHGGDGTRDGGFGDIGATGGNGRPVGRLYGTETVPAWDCAPDCPVGELDRQSGERPGMSGGGKHREGYGGGMFGGVDSTDTARSDSGGASRFYPTFRYVPKAPRSMREAGLVAAEGERANDHPTVKHDDLMRWLVRLVTPPGGVVLDMFMGSGSTGRGAILEGCRFIGIDAEAHYVEIAKARIKDAEPKPERQLTIFELLAS